MTRYRRDTSHEDAELEALEAQFKEDTEGGDPEPVEVKKLSGEEETFKKRYGDLRSHAQKRQSEYEERIRKLEEQLQNTTAQKLELPDVSSKEDAEKWIAKYPELAKVFRYLAVEQDTKVKEDLNKTREAVQEMKREEEKRRAYLRLLELHSDFETIANDPKFVDWLLTKPQRMQDALWVNIDPEDAASVIDVYKAHLIVSEKNTPAKKKEDTARAAESVTRPTSRGAPDAGEDEIKWSESYVEKMSARDKNWFDRNEDKIMAAIRNGKFEYDMTGSAR